MPVWIQVHKKYNVGDKFDDNHCVAEIKQMVPYTILIQNHNIKNYNIAHPESKIDLISEQLSTYVRVSGNQLELFGDLT